MRRGRLLAGCLVASAALHLAAGAHYDFGKDLVERSASPGGEYAVVGDLADLTMGMAVPEAVEPVVEEEIEPVEEMPAEETARETAPVKEPAEQAQIAPEVVEPPLQAALSPILRDSVSPVRPAPSEVAALTMAEPVEAIEPAPQDEPEPDDEVAALAPQEAEPVAPESVDAEVVVAPVPAQKPRVRPARREVSKKRLVRKRKPVQRGNAQQDARRGQSQGVTTSQTGDGGRKATSNYLGRVNARLQRAKRYPRAARGADGTVLVRFTIARSGAVSGLRVVRSSGNGGLDEAAVSNVRRVAPLPGFPDEMTQNSQTVTVPFRFEAP